MTPRELWQRYQAWSFEDAALGLRLDLSRMGIEERAFAEREPLLQAAYEQMAALEQGAIANPDEKRMVGHYWLRAPELAPTSAIAAAIRGMQERVADFAAACTTGSVAPARARAFRHAARDRHRRLGARAAARGRRAGRRRRPPDAALPRQHRSRRHRPGAGRPRRRARRDARGRDLEVGRHARDAQRHARGGGRLRARAGSPSAGTRSPSPQEGSALDRHAREQGFLERFPMWDWVGGRTSVTSAVGLLPAALQGIDVDALLDGRRGDGRGHARGARRARTRRRCSRSPGTPPARAAARRTWWCCRTRTGCCSSAATCSSSSWSRSARSRTCDGRVVHQGLAVYGNKGSTDQHAFVQQLRDGAADFFVTFIHVLEDRERRAASRSSRA